MAKRETGDHLVWHSSESDTVEVYTPAFYGHEKWKLGVLRAPLSQLQGRFTVGVIGNA